VIVAVISYVLNIKGIKQDMIATFYSPQTRFWELLSGSLLGWIALYKQIAFINIKSNINKLLSLIVYSEKSGAKGQTLADITSFAGLSLLSYGFYRINQELAFPGKWALIPISGAVMIIAAGSRAWVNRVILSNRVFIWFGLISYPLYLWH
jgi:peptidoglycan/LPS O-acetylase OafA/YrhL